MVLALQQQNCFAAKAVMLYFWIGQQVFIALSRAKVGDGIVAGLCVAAIALAADIILKAFAARRARAMGNSLNHG